MHVVTPYMRQLTASATSRSATSPFSCKRASDMPRSLLIIASLFLLGASQTAVAAEGKALYEATCIACHGAKAQGAIPGVPDLAQGGRLSKPDAELVANILNGFQSKGSPMAMPSKGGNPNLTAADAKALVTYMRALTGTSPTVAPKRAPVSATAIDAAAVPSPTPAAAPPPAAAAAPASPATTAATTTAASSPRSSAASAPQDMAAFARGAKAWADNCSRCHSMRDPKDLTDRQWKVVMTHMRLRAGLDGQLVRDITTFLQQSN